LELKNSTLKADGIGKATEDSPILDRVSNRESQVQLREQPFDRLSSQTEEINTFPDGRAADSRSCPLLGRSSRCVKGHSRIHNFYTKASILMPRGIVDLEQVQVDERCSFNLVPQSIAMDLDLILFSNEILTV